MVRSTRGVFDLVDNIYGVDVSSKDYPRQPLEHPSNLDTTMLLPILSLKGREIFRLTARRPSFFFLARLPLALFYLSYCYKFAYVR